MFITFVTFIGHEIIDQSFPRRNGRVGETMAVMAVGIHDSF